MKKEKVMKRKKGETIIIYPTVPGVELYFWTGSMVGFRDRKQVEKNLDFNHVLAIQKMGGRIGYYRVDHNKKTGSYLGLLYKDALRTLLERFPGALTPPKEIPLKTKKGLSESLFQSLGVQSLG